MIFTYKQPTPSDNARIWEYIYNKCEKDGSVATSLVYVEPFEWKGYTITSMEGRSCRKWRDGYVWLMDEDNTLSIHIAEALFTDLPPLKARTSLS